MPDSGPAPVRWGIMSAAGIARKEFLPGLRAAGGTAEAVAARDPDRAAKFAAEQGINRTVPDYQALIGDPAVDAVYLPLPNSLHADWTIAALRAGKPVLCEKPLGGTLADTERVLAAARETGTLLWEAFVFPFQDQMERIRGLLADGVIGELREIQSGFHFLLADPADIRLRRGLDGGALNDIGCYPVRLARHLFAAEHEAAWAAAVTGGDGVDVDTQGVLGFPDSRRLLLSCGFRRSLDRFARLLGSRGQIHITSPFHPGREDTFTVFAAGQPAATHSARGTEPAFTAAIRHIHAVLRGTVPPRYLAVNTALGNARALHDLRESATAQG